MPFDPSSFIASVFVNKTYFLDLIYSFIVTVLFISMCFSFSSENTSMGQLHVFFESVNISSFSSFFKHMDDWFLQLPVAFDEFLLLMAFSVLTVIFASDHLPFDSRIGFTFFLLIIFCSDRNVLFTYVNLLIFFLCLVLGVWFYTIRGEPKDKYEFKEALLEAMTQAFEKLFILFVSLFYVLFLIFYLFTDTDRLFPGRK